MTSDIVMPTAPGTVICTLCKRTVFVTSAIYPATFRTECQNASCPVNAKYKPEPIPEFGEPPPFVNHIEFAEDDDS